MPSGKDILFFSDTIFDIDLGIIEVMKKKYSNPKLVKTNILNADPLFFKSYLIEDCTTNILDSVLVDEAKSSSTDLYNDILKNDYLNVIRAAPMTGLMNLVLLHKEAENNTNIKPVVICKSELETNILHSLNQDIETILCKTEDDLKEIMLERFTRIHVRHIQDLYNLKFENIEGKSLIVLSYRFNFELSNKDRLLDKYTALLSDVNEFQVMIPYLDYACPEG